MISGQGQSVLTSVETRTVTEYESIGKNGPLSSCLSTNDVTAIQDSSISDTYDSNSPLLSSLGAHFVTTEVTVTESTSFATTNGELSSQRTSWIIKTVSISRELSSEESTQITVRTIVDQSVSTKLITKTEVTQSVFSTLYSDVGTLVFSAAPFQSFVSSMRDSAQHFSASYSRVGSGDSLPTLNSESLTSSISPSRTLAATDFTSEDTTPSTMFGTLTNQSEHSTLLTNFQTELNTLVDLSSDILDSRVPSSVISSQPNTPMSSPEASQIPMSEAPILSSSMRDDATTSSSSSYLQLSLSSYLSSGSPTITTSIDGYTTFPTSAFISPSYSLTTSSSWTPTPSLHVSTPQETSSNGRSVEKPEAPPSVSQSNTVYSRTTNQALSEKTPTYKTTTRTFKINKSGRSFVGAALHTHASLNVSWSYTEVGTTQIESSMPFQLTETAAQTTLGTSLYQPWSHSSPVAVTSPFHQTMQSNTDILLTKYLSITAQNPFSMVSSPGNEVSDSISSSENVDQIVSPSRFENSFTFKGTSDILSATFVSYSHTESVGDISQKSSRLINSFPAERSKTPIDSRTTLALTESDLLVSIAPSSTVVKHYSMNTDSSVTQSGSETKRIVQYTSGSMVSPLTSQTPTMGEGLRSVHSSIDLIDISTNSYAARGQGSLSPTDALSTNTPKFSKLKITTGVQSTIPLTTFIAPTLNTKLAFATTPLSTYTVHCDPYGPDESLTPNCTTPVTQELSVEGSFNGTHVLDGK